MTKYDMGGRSEFDILSDILFNGPTCFSVTFNTLSKIEWTSLCTVTCFEGIVFFDIRPW